MSRRNNQTNTIIKWVIIIGDFLVLNLLLLALQKYHPAVSSWIPAKKEVFWVVCNMAMILSQWKFCTIIHERIVSGGDILRRVITLNIVQIITAYLVM
jgi:putative colanic acid biosynthesis UDP-glucose lipid carrier transferase